VNSFVCSSLTLSQSKAIYRAVALKKRTNWMGNGNDHERFSHYSTIPTYLNVGIIIAVINHSMDPLLS